VSTVSVGTNTQPGKTAAPKRTIRYRFRKIWRVSLFVALIPFLAPDMLAGPFGFDPEIVKFLSGVFCLIPLATFIEVVTEELIENLGQLIGGLLHALFGNAAFFAITVSSLIAASRLPTTEQNNLVQVVQSSIAGTIIINILFILGFSILFGGFRNGRMQFSAEYSNQYAEMLTVAVVALALPSLGATLGVSVGILSSKNLALKADQGEIGTLSDITAVVLIIAYICYIAWTVFKFRDQAAKPESPEENTTAELEGDLFGPLAVNVAPIEEAQQREQLNRAALAGSPTLPKDSAMNIAPVTALPGHTATAADIINERLRRQVEAQGNHRTHAEQEEVDRKRGIALWELALLVMGIGGVVFISDKMAESVRSFIEHSHNTQSLSPFFVGFIILPIASNIVEFSAAASAAWHDRMETSLAVTAGSTIQVALLIAPALILVGHIVGLGQMNLIFGYFVLAVFALIAYLFQIITVDGETSWLEGVQLVSFFAVIAAVAFFANTPATPATP